MNSNESSIEQTIQYMTSVGHNINSIDDFKNNVLIYAILHSKSLRTIKSIVSSNININQKINYRAGVIALRTAIHVPVRFQINGRSLNESLQPMNTLIS